MNQLTKKKLINEGIYEKKLKSFTEVQIQILLDRRKDHLKTLLLFQGAQIERIQNLFQKSLQCYQI